MYENSSFSCGGWPELGWNNRRIRQKTKLLPTIPL